MKVCGFSFIRNAVKFDYPIVEAITSVLPLCDEFILMLGNSEDETRKLVESIGSPKIKIYDSVWDDSLRVGGRVLAVETDKALDKVSDDYDWAFYIQGDEVIHEKYLPPIKAAMERWKDDSQVEGLLFGYKHFYGYYDYIGDSTRWYRNEIRIIRPGIGVASYRDAQGFRIDGRSLVVKPVDAEVYHYGWVKPPVKQQEKRKYFNSLWHNDNWLRKNTIEGNEFDYSTIDSLSKFKDTHPAVMADRIKRVNWKFTYNPSQRKLSFKSRFKLGFEKAFGYRLWEYKNYTLLK